MMADGADGTGYKKKGSADNDPKGDDGHGSNPGGFGRLCTQHSKIEFALFGPGGGGNLWQEVNTIRNDVRTILDEDRRKRDVGTKWKIAIAASLLGTAGLLAVKILEFILSRPR